MKLLTRMTFFGFRIAPLLLAVYWILMFTGTHVPGQQVVKDWDVSDKVMHFCGFAGLAFLLAWALPRRIGPGIPGLMVAALLGCAYAAIDELTQGLVPRRRPDVEDFLADCFGMAFGFALYLVLRTLLVRSNRRSLRLPPADYWDAAARSNDWTARQAAKSRHPSS